MQMNLRLFFDTETTGLPTWGKPSDNPIQPHIVELAADLVDINTRETMASMDVLVKPEGWVIPKEAMDCHGITNELADAVGVPEHYALNWFFELWAAGDRCRIVAHNCTFDHRMMRIGAKRYFPDSILKAWGKPEKGVNYECTGLMSKPIMQMPPYGKYGWKMPKLTEAYEHFTGNPLVNAHRARADVDACKAVYFAILDAGGSPEAA
jgi:DNA polymerase-3 subunit epsilon